MEQLNENPPSEQTQESPPETFHAVAESSVEKTAEMLKDEAIALFHFVRDMGDSALTAMQHRHAKGLGATDEELAARPETPPA
jgi:hypothetical protein